MTTMGAMECVESLLEVLAGEYGESDSAEAQAEVAWATQCLDEWQGPREDQP